MKHGFAPSGRDAHLRLDFSVVVVFAMLLLGGCASGDDPRNPREDALESRLDQLIELQMANDPVERSQKDIELIARWVAPGRLDVGLTNTATEPVRVNIECFRLILPPSRELHKVELASRKSFPDAVVEPGASAGGQLLVSPGLAREGARLVFNHVYNGGRVKPAMTLIDP